ncbi:MAG: protein kinase [bacterium]
MGTLRIDDPHALNALLIPILRSQSAATSVIVADERGREHMLLKTQTGWLNRRIDRSAEPRATHWEVLGPDGAVVDAYSKDLDYTSASRPWFQAAQAAALDEIVWTKPYIFFTTKDPGITASTRVPAPTGEYVIALDLMLQDISAFTSSLEVAEYGVVAVVSRDGQVIGLPNTTDSRTPAAVLSSVEDLNRPEIAAAFARAQIGAAGTERTIIGQEPWWITSKPVGPTNLQFITVVAIPETALRRPIVSQQLALAGMALFAVAFGLALMWQSNRQIQRVRDRANQENIFGPYAPIETLGSSATSEVFRAQRDALQTGLVVKVSQRQDHAKMTAVAKDLANTLDPRLGWPIDFGVAPDGLFYHVRVDVGGTPLSQWVTEPVSPEVVRHVMAELVSGLSRFHASCGPHGNLKPTNVLIDADAAMPRVALVDPLGLSAHTESASRAGIVAPETIENPTAVHEASDVYALGALLYLMLNGRAAYAGQTPNAILMKQLTEDPTPHNADVDVTLAELADRCLRRRPGNRPSLREVQRALET